jgi:hypothetical protein
MTATIETRMPTDDEPFVDIGEWNGTRAIGGYIEAGRLYLFEYRNGMFGIATHPPGTITQEDLVKLTVAPHAPLEKWEVAVKNYSENEGTLAGLISAGILQPPHRWIPSGWVMLPVCQLPKFAHLAGFNVNTPRPTKVEPTEAGGTRLTLANEGERDHYISYFWPSRYGTHVPGEYVVSDRNGNRLGTICVFGDTVTFYPPAR